MNRYLWLLDNGHGGMIDGVYQTTYGKMSPVWPDGRQLFEGEFNRAVVERIMKLCIANEVAYCQLVPEQEDISMPERVRRANEVFRVEYNGGGYECVFLSIHANGGGGTGWEIFTTKGETLSDEIATVFYENVKKSFPEFRMRTDYVDGDPDKEAQFYVIRNTVMPAVLTENFFMDTLTPDCELIMSEEGRDRIAIAHVEAMLEWEGRPKKVDPAGLQGATLPRIYKPVA